MNLFKQLSRVGFVSKQNVRKVVGRIDGVWSWLFKHLSLMQTIPRPFPRLELNTKLVKCLIVKSLGFFPPRTNCFLY